MHLLENGEISEKRVQTFLANHKLQEELMTQYTKESIRYVKKNEGLLDAIESGEKSLPEILAKGHLAGHGSIGRSHV